MTTRKEWEANERKTNAEVLDRAGRRCERCHGLGDFRGIAIHHKDPRGIGGTRHLYTADEKICLCAICHDLAHGIKDIML